MIKAMVLAAGVGSRLDPISRHLPKPLVPVLNKPVIEHILDCLKQNDISDVIANTHYLAPKLTEYFASNPPGDMCLQFIHEEELSGDAGGVRACRDFLSGDTFVVIMGDLFTNADLSVLIAAHKDKRALATIGIKKVDNVSRYGVLLRDELGFVKAFQEKPSQSEAISNEISTGIYILEPEIFEHIPVNGVYGFGKQLFPSLVEKGLRVLGHEIKGFWSDIGTLQDLFDTNMDALIGNFSVIKRPESFHDNFSDKISGRHVLVGKDSKLLEGVNLRESCIIGENCVVGADSDLENCLLLAGSVLPTASVLRNCIHAFGQTINTQMSVKPGR